MFGAVGHKSNPYNLQMDLFRQLEHNSSGGIVVPDAHVIFDLPDVVVHHTHIIRCPRIHDLRAEAFCITAAPDDAGTFCDRGEKTGIQFGPGCFNT